MLTHYKSLVYSLVGKSKTATLAVSKQPIQLNRYMENQGIKRWNDIHIQICIALIGRPTTDCYGHTKPLVFEDIINKADRMVHLLKEREERISSNS